jgi:hypothetical protein
MAENLRKLELPEWVKLVKKYCPEFR